MALARRKARRLPAAVTVELSQVITFMQLIWAVDHELERISFRMGERLGVTIPQRMCLLLIAATPGILASQLAERLHLHRGTMSGILARLHSAGFIIRTAEPTDARRVGLTLTAAGRRVVRRQRGTFEAAVRALLAGTSSAERTATARVLTRLRQELQNA